MKYSVIEGQGKDLITPGKQLLSEKGIDFLGRLEIEGSKYNVYDDNNNLTGILSVDIGDGGITFGFGHYVAYNDTQKQKYLQEVYALAFMEGVFVPIELCIKIKHDDVNYNKIYNVQALDKFIEDNNILLTQYQYDALVCMAFLRRIPSDLRELILQKSKEKALYSDYEKEFFDIALDDFKSLSSFDRYGSGWTNRLKNEVDVYFHNDYSKKY